MSSIAWANNHSLATGATAPAQPHHDQAATAPAHAAKEVPAHQADTVELSASARAHMLYMEGEDPITIARMLPANAQAVEQYLGITDQEMLRLMEARA